MKPELEFVQLSHFIEVARAKNFTRAAENIGISQSALSRNIIRLEEKIGQPLLERKPREVSLTDLGKLFLGRAEQILALVDDTFAEITDSGNSGRVRLAVIPTIAPFFLPRVLKEFSLSHPNVSVIVSEETTQTILKRVNHGEIDLAILALPVNEKYLEIETLFDEELVLVLPNEHPLEKNKSITLNDIQSYPFVMLDEAHCLSDNIASFCRQRNIQPLSVERTSQLATVQELVSLSHGISMVPKMAQVLDESGRRVYRSLTGDVPHRTVAMVTNPYRFESQWASALKEFLREFVNRDPSQPNNTNEPT